MTDNRKKEITDKYLKSSNDDSILELSVQELIYLYSAVLAEQKKDPENKEWAERRQYVFSSVIMRFMNSDELYIAYHVMTNYPYIDVRGCAWLFTEKEFSKAAHEHYFKEGVPLTMKTVTGKDAVVEQLLELLRIGVEQIIVDNGQPNVTIRLKDIITGSGENRQLTTTSPELMFTIINALELSYASDGKHPDLPALDKKTEELVKSSRLLVPIKLDRHLEDGESLHITEETPSQIAVVNPLKTEKGFIAAFTDWKEFTKLYSKDEWNAVIMDHTTLKDAASRVDGFIINPAGFMFVVRNEEENK